MNPLHQISVLQSLYSPQVWALALVYFGLVAYATAARLLAAADHQGVQTSNFATDWVTAIARTRSGPRSWSGTATTPTAPASVDTPPSGF